MDLTAFLVPVILLAILIYIYINIKPTYYVEKLYVYPIKSCHRVSVDKIELTKGGLKHDRVFCLLDENNIVLNQRKLPKMATILPQILEEENILRVKSKSVDNSIDNSIDIELDVELCSANVAINVVQFQVCQSTCYGFVEDDKTNRWFSEALGKRCKLVRLIPEDFYRKPDPRFVHFFGEDEYPLAYQDSGQILLISKDSHRELNWRIFNKYGKKYPDFMIPLNRFRPNIVVERVGGWNFYKAHKEDSWTNFQIGNNMIRKVKKCDRCILTTVDQKKGTQLDGELKYEPLKTLREYRCSNLDKDIKLFGSNTPFFGIKCSYNVNCSNIINLNDTVHL